MFSAFRRIGRRPARGFSLIELGIVIAVIAVLASVVIFGRGFIAAGRVSKTVEALNTVRKAGAAFAGLYGGTVKASNGSEIGPLRQRGLLPDQSGRTDWLVAGDASGGTGFVVKDIRFGRNTQGNQNAVLIVVETPEAPQAQDIYRSVESDPNFIKTGIQVGGLACASAEPTTQTSVNVCFNL